MKQLGFFTLSLPIDLDMLPESVLSDIHTAFIDTWHQLTSFISQVRKCQKLADYYLLQEELGRHVLKADSKVSDSNVAIYQAKKELNRIGNIADPEKKRYLLGKLFEAPSILPNRKTIPYCRGCHGVATLSIQCSYNS
jgi:hypothetical protein